MFIIKQSKFLIIKKKILEKLTVRRNTDQIKKKVLHSNEMVKKFITFDLVVIHNVLVVVLWTFRNRSFTFENRFNSLIKSITGKTESAI